MTRVVIVLDAEGVYQSTYADSEVSVEVLKRGADDKAIDAAEQSLDEVVQ
jgi:hypothetical protein